MSRTLTSRQAQLLRYVMVRTTAFGAPPTLKEIREEMGVASNRGATCHLLALEAKGFVALGDGSGAARAIVVRRDPDGVPVALRFVPREGA